MIHIGGEGITALQVHEIEVEGSAGIGGFGYHIDIIHIYPDPQIAGGTGDFGRVPPGTAVGERLIAKIAEINQVVGGVGRCTGGCTR